MALTRSSSTRSSTNNGYGRSNNSSSNKSNRSSIINKYDSLLHHSFILLLLWSSIASSSSAPESRPSFSIRLPGGSFFHDDTDYDDSTSHGRLIGAGREFSIFDNREIRGGSTGNGYNKYNINNNLNDKRQRPYASMAGRQYSYRNFRGSSLPSSFSSPYYEHQHVKTPRIVQDIQYWWRNTVIPTVQTWPKFACRIEPTTTLKIRKTFRPLKTIIRIGADYNTQLGVWQFKSSWEDAIIGGKLTLAGRELQLTKSWQLSVGK